MFELCAERPAIPAARKKLRTQYFLALLVILLVSVCCVGTPTPRRRPVVEKYGQLRVQGNRIVDRNGQAVQLRGMSLYWSQWIPKYYTYNTVRWLRDDWKITVIRAAMAVQLGRVCHEPDGRAQQGDRGRRCGHRAWAYT